MGSMSSAEALIRSLNLIPHPAEGGYYRETYRSKEVFSPLPERYRGERAFSTAIYYLLADGAYSKLHRLESDEVFHFYLGDPVEMLLLPEEGSAAEVVTLGPNVENGERLQQVVPRGWVQGARLKENGSYALLGCTVAPGFSFEDFSLCDADALTKRFPDLEGIIRSLS